MRATVYEFTYPPIIRAFVDVLESGADVKIVYHAPEAGSRVVGQNPGASTVVSFSGEPAQMPVEYHRTEVRSVSHPDDITTAALAAVLAATLTAGSVEAQADEGVSYQIDTELLRHCRAPVGAGGTTPSQGCFGYIMGVVDLMEMEGTVCLPKIVIGDLTEIFVRELEITTYNKDPRYMKFPAAGTVFNAVHKAFPCETSKPRG